MLVPSDHASHTDIRVPYALSRSCRVTTHLTHDDAGNERSEAGVDLCSMSLHVILRMRLEEHETTRRQLSAVHARPLW